MTSGRVILYTVSDVEPLDVPPGSYSHELPPDLRSARPVAEPATVDRQLREDTRLRYRIND
jgi:hypothetical protein